MKRASIAILVAVAAGLALPGSGAGEARTAASACVPAGAEVVARSHDAVVVRRLRTTAYTGERVPHHYGCLLSRGRLVRLDDNDGGLGAFLDRPVRFAGRHVAFESNFVNMGSASDYAEVVVTDLRRGVRLLSDCTGEVDEENDFECFGDPVISLVLRDTGGVAWIDEDGAVRKHDRGARRHRLLDFGRVERRSLRLRGSRLSWVRAGQRRTATLR